MACPDAPNECLECSSQAAALAPHPVEVPPAALEPVNGTCVPCPAGCADCTSPDYCSLCSAEGHFSSPDAGACLPCSDPACGSCSENGCDWCKEGYAFNTSDVCAPLAPGTAAGGLPTGAAA